MALRRTCVLPKRLVGGARRTVKQIYIIISWCFETKKIFLPKQLGKKGLSKDSYAVSAVSVSKDPRRQCRGHQGADGGCWLRCWEPEVRIERVNGGTDGPNGSSAQIWGGEIDS